MAQIEKQGSRLVVKGALTMQTVNIMLAEVATMFTDAELEMDFEQVTEVDSSAVSLMFELLRQAHGHKTSLVFSHVPATLISLATLYGVDDILPRRPH